jgi:hypothetical protein
MSFESLGKLIAEDGEAATPTETKPTPVLG